jgi:hypothetical protein
MICQRCGKACADRTQGRPVRLAGKQLFFCNACSPHSPTGGGGTDRESSRKVLRATAQLGEPVAPYPGR